MRFALLCDDPAVEPIVKRLTEGAGNHRLAYIAGKPPFSVAATGTAASVKFVDHWEDLLTARDLDAVIIGGSSALILDGAKQLSTASIPLFFVPRSSQGSTFIYELSLIRDDNRVPLVPMQWYRYDAAAIEMKAEIDSGKLGQIQFLQVIRTRSGASASTPISLADVDAELLLDVDLLRWMMGDYDQVTCLRTGATTDGVLMQNVVLAGRTLPEANWSIAPAAGADQWLLTVRGDRGTATLRREAGSYRFASESDGRQVEGDPTDSVQHAIDAFVEVIGKPLKKDATSAAIDRGWADLVKCFETVDATHRSIRRKRTIELHFEPMSERAIFKTQMTAIGCGMLVATLLLLLVYLGVASFVEPTINPRTITSSDSDQGTAEVGAVGLSKPQTALPFAHRILQVLRLLVFAPLVVFLVAQVLLPLTRPSSNERDHSGHS